MNKFLEIFQDKLGQMSSKRICGVIGFLVCLIAFLYCTYLVILAPTCIDILLMCCVGLLGTDSIADIWKLKKEPEN